MISKRIDYISGSEARKGQKWRTWEDLDDIVLVEKKGGKEGEMEEWDLVEEFLSRIRDPEENDEEHESEDLFGREVLKLSTRVTFISSQRVRLFFFGYFSLLCLSFLFSFCSCLGLPLSHEGLQTMSASY